MSFFWLASCGGGSGDFSPAPVPDPPPPTSGIDRGGVAQGVITGFGSIFVNGIRFDTSTASFTIDDDPGTESDLSVGQVVTVIGSIDDDGSSGTASEVIFEDQVEGPITSVDTAAQILVVLGQTVRIDSETVFDDGIAPNGIEGLSIGEVVEISGFVSADGTILATHIERTDDTQFEVTGVVSSLDVATMTFQINGQVIDYSAATLEDFPDGQIDDEMRVEVEGSMLDSGGRLIATGVEFEGGDPPGDNDDDIEIEGLITRFVSATDFDVAGRPVTTTSLTLFEHGSANDLAEGVKVEVEGNFDIEGVLVAEKVSLRRNSSIELAAPVDSVNTATASLTVLGLTVTTSALTRFEDDSDVDADTFGLGDIDSGNWVEVKAFTDDNGNLIATEVERDDADDEIEIRAPLQSASQPDMQLLGLNIQTDASTTFEDRNDSPISADDFFAAAVTGASVQVRGVVIADGVILASEAELE